MGNQANDETYYSLRIREVVEETADAKSLIFEVPSADAGTFRYRPGQFLTLRVSHQGRHLLRCYSLASCPLTNDAPRVTIKRVVDGRASNWICDRAKAGDTMEVKPPAGHFTPRSLDGDFMFFAGGSGITPIMSIIKSALLAGRGRLSLIYANRDERSVIFRDALSALVRENPSRLQIVHWLDSVQGIPLASNFEQLAKPFAGADSYICGPEAFMDTALTGVRALGMPPARVHVERFVSLPDEEDAAPEAGAPAADEEIHLEVKLDGIHHELKCSRSEPLLNAMLRAGLKAPHSCRAGACATCMCTLEEGKVHLRNNQVLDKNDLAQGWILACQAIADTPSVRVRFPD
jgi:3-ketosteroid 9alpha-monooxygenase subunit B